METDHIPVLKPRLPGLKHLSPYLERIDATRVYTNYGPLHEELGARLELMFDSPPGSLTLASSGTAALDPGLRLDGINDGLDQFGHQLDDMSGLSFSTSFLADLTVWT